MTLCHYCRRDRPDGLACANTRWMEDMAIEGDDVCFVTLEKLGGGEKGMRYVRLNRESFLTRKPARP